MKIQLTSTKIINWVSVLMILVMVVLLFTPYWQYETKEKNEEGKRVEVVKTVSINDYVWMPREHKDLTKEFKALYPEAPKDLTKEEKEAWPAFWINDLVLMPVLVLALGLVLGAISLWYSNVPFSALLALFLGALGAYSYAARPEFQLGNPTLHIIVSAVTAAVGLAGVVWFIVKAILAKKQKA